MTGAFAVLIGGKDIFHEVEARLEAAGAVVELGILRRMSSDEVDMVIERERGRGC